MELARICLNDHLQKVRDFHDVDASRYREQRYHSDTCEGLAYLTRKELILKMADLEPGKVLDVGCGPGILTGDLLRRKHEVYSADLSIEMIRHARSQVRPDSKDGAAHFAVSDASQICFSDNRMDMVLSIGLLCYVKNHGVVLSEIYRVLKPGGITIFQINNIRWSALYKMFVPLYRHLKAKITGKNYDGLDFEFNFSSRQEFLKTLKDSRFTIIDLERYDFRIPFVDIIFPNLSVKLGGFMFRNRYSRFFRCFAHGLLIKARK